jgi:hypothetical protein
MTAKNNTGNEPASSEPKICQSIVPIIQCPTPAMNVSGTAWAISDPMILAIGSCGYKTIRIYALADVIFDFERPVITKK